MAATAAGLLCALVGVAACNTGSATLPRQIAAYVPSFVPPPSVRLPIGPDTLERHFQILVEISDIELIHGIEFDLSYPADLLRFDGVTEGIWLSEDGDVDTFLDVAVARPGLLVARHGRPAQEAPVPSDDVTVGLVALEFTLIGSGEGTLSFSNRRVFQDGAGTEVPGVSWGTGTLTADISEE